VKFTYEPGATPIDLDGAKDLIPQLTTQEQLNAFEQTNIAAAMDWARKSRKLKTELLSVDGLCLVHRKMFSETWKWAGAFRRKDLNIGVPWAQIPEKLKMLCDDVAYWDQHHTYLPAEIAVRFHHRLVQIHPFINGNGRMSRLAADLFLLHRKHSPLTWGSSINLLDANPDRSEYIAALREADHGQIGRLLKFAIG
jgi:Fic-DOC domain mobile mystery protein B